MDISTKKGDDGTTGLLFGGRVAKDSDLPAAYGAVDEAQATLGLARAESEPGSDLDVHLTTICAHLWVLMAELATLPEHRHKLTDDQSRVSPDMVDRLEAIGADVDGRFDPPTEFTVPGQSRQAALLDLARTVVRRAERAAVTVHVEGSLAVTYLNRLSDVVWTMARWQEGDTLTARSASGTDA